MTTPSCRLLILRRARTSKTKGRAVPEHHLAGYGHLAQWHRCIAHSYHPSMSFRPCRVRKYLNILIELNPVLMNPRHALRKSGTYTNLDFAPPPRFKNTETASDAGSIRSNGTGISYTHLHNIRTGAYRISRLPVGMVGTRDDMAASLRPQWDMRS